MAIKHHQSSLAKKNTVEEFVHVISSQRVSFCSIRRRHGQGSVSYTQRTVLASLLIHSWNIPGFHDLHAIKSLEPINSPVPSLVFVT